MKNALDWVVGSGELVDKPVVLFNASPRGTYAQASLTETLTVMTARLVAEAAVTLQHLGKPLTAGQIAQDAEMSAALRRGLVLFTRAIGEAKLAATPFGRNVSYQVVQSRSDRVGSYTEFLYGLQLPVHPECAIAECLGACHVPSGKGRECNLWRTEVERIEGHAIRRGSGLYACTRSVLST